jgi:hypothetical protein
LEVVDLFRASSFGDRSKGSVSAISARVLCGAVNEDQVSAITNDGVPEVLSLIVRSEAFFHLVAGSLKEFSTAAAVR